MSKIDITVTSTIRPSILDRTLSSFVKNIFFDTSSYRLLINIDPVGDKSRNVKDVINVAKMYFDDVFINTPDEEGFTKAVMWLWSNTTSDYVFHLEDDWVLNRKIEINDMTHIIDRYPRICSVRLSKGDIFGGKEIIRSYRCPYKDKNEKVPFDLFPRISLNPTLFRGEFVREAVSVMTDRLNPESQLVTGHAKKKEDRKGIDCNSVAIEEFLSRWDHSVIAFDSATPWVTDIGRSWRRKNKIKRKYDFMYWQ